MGAPDRNHRPQYGWDRVTFLNSEALGEPGGLLPSETVAIVRPNGLYRVTVAGRVEGGDSSGDGRFGFLVEGSNTGGVAASEWIVLAETNIDETFTAGLITLQTRVLAFANGAVAGQGFIGEASVPVDRWRFIRVRTFVSFQGVGPAVSFEVSIRMTGIGADGQRTDYDNTLVRTSGDASEPASDPVKKPEGVRYISAQAIVDAMILDPAVSNGFRLLLQVAQNGNAVNNNQWATLDQLGPFVAAGETGFFTNGQARLIDLSGFQFYRFTAEKVPVPPGVLSSDISSYTIRCLTTFDDADWIDGEQGIPLLHESIRKTFVQIAFDPVTGVAPAVEVRMQICDMNQTPIRAGRRVGLLLANSGDGFSDDLSGLATFTSVTAPATLVYGAGNNVAVVETDTDGTATIQIATGGAVPLFIVAWNDWVPQIPANGFFGPGQIVIATDRGQLT